MARSKLLVSLLVLVGVCTLAATSFAKPAAQPKCGLNGDYSFFFWDPDEPIAGVGFFTVQLDPSTKCRSGVVLPGGIINCNAPKGGIFEDFIEDGFVFLETDGEGTMEIETNSSDGICETGRNALELDISVVLGGKTMLFNSNGVDLVQSGTTPNAGYDYTLTGRADKCFAGQISGCYDIRFWASDRLIKPLSTVEPESDGFGTKTGDCTICVKGAGGATGGTCRCHVLAGDGAFETLSEIEGGG